MLKSTPAIHDDEGREPLAGEVGVAVVGLGYWGPNLLRVLGDNLDAKVRWICDLDSRAPGQVPPAASGCPGHDPDRARAGRSQRRRGDHRHAGAHAL